MVCSCTDGGWACYATDACFIESCAGRACEEDSDCEGGGVTTYCMDGTCARELVRDEWSSGPSVPLTIGNCGGDSDAFELTDLTVTGDTLFLTVAYSGGCAEHQFRVCWDDTFTGTAPAEARLSLQHDDGDDACEAYPSEVLEVPLSALSDAYRTRFTSRAGSVLINVLDRAASYGFL